MALIKCPECGHEISEKAKMCPNCGYQVNGEEPNDSRKNKNFLSKMILVVGVMIITLLVIGCIISTCLKNSKTEKVKDAQETDNEAPTFQNLPKELVYYIGDDVDFHDIIKENEVKVVDNIDTDIEIQIDYSEISLDVPGEYKLFLTAEDKAGNETQLEIPVQIKDYETHKNYINATTLEKRNLTAISSGGYEYDGIHISDSEMEWLEAGTMYRSIAKQLEGFYLFGDKLYGNWDADIPKTVFGIEKPATYNEMKTYVDKVILLITPNSTLPQILNWFQSCSTVKGTFDYNKAYFSFEVSDLTATAEEMGITEKMLGYILAVIDEYAPEASFSKNTYTCKLQVVGDAARNDKNIITPEDFITWKGESNESCTESNELNQIIEGGYDFTYEYVDYSVDYNVGKTNRDVDVGMSYNTVLYHYGQGKEASFNMSSDLLYEAILQAPDDQKPKDTENFFSNIQSYMSYEMEDKSAELVFFFNMKQEVVFILFNTVPIYS